MRSSSKRESDVLVEVERRCLVCDLVDVVVEPADTDAIGPECRSCHAPTERTQVLSRRKAPRERNPHAAALGRLGGLKGGRARAEALTPRRRRDIARQAAHARWRKDDNA
jgi:hypothetical protein